MSTRRMKKKEIAEHTGLSQYAIDIGCKRGTIPYIKYGNRMYFDPEAVDAALKLEEEENQKKAKAAYEDAKPKEVIHYGKLKDLLNDVI